MNIVARLFTLVLAFSTSALMLFGQSASIQWQETFGGTTFDQAESVIQTADGGFMATGIATSTNGDVTGNHGFGDLWLTKISPTGVLQWQKTLGGTADESSFAVIQTSDLGYVVAGTSTSTNGDVTLNHGAVDFWIVKVNSTGSIIWKTTLGGSSVDIPYDIKQTTDGGFIVAGYTVSNDGDITNNNGFEDFWIVKLSGSGTLQWQKTFGGSQDERAFSISQTIDGGYIAAGYTRSTDGDVTGNHGDYDYWIVKLSSTGTLQWQRTLGGTLSDQAHTIQQTADGGYITAGFTASSNGDVTFNHGFEDLWIVKLNNAGVVQWQKSLGGSGVDQAFQVKEVSSGGFIFGGSSYSLDGDVTGNHGGYDFWIVRTDNFGNIVWQKSLGGSSVEECYSISTTTNNGFIACGGTNSNDGDVTGNHGDFDYWVVKLNETSNAPLPIELKSFEVFNSGAKNILKWTTTSETNNDHFELERKSGAEDFKVLGRINGNGSTTLTHNYTYGDDEIGNGGTFYYRLKQVDFDGSFSYSQIVRAEIKIRVPGIKIFPNPGISQFTLKTELKRGLVEIFNSVGEKIYSKRTESLNGSLISLHVPGGIYSVRVSDEEGSVSTMLVIQ